MDVSKDMTPDEFVDAVMEMVFERPLVDHPFLDRLERGEISRAQIAKSCYQMLYHFNHAVRCVGAALSQNMDRAARTSIMENLIDEETEFRCGDASHYSLAMDFGVACGYDREEIERTNSDGTLRVHPQLEEAMEDMALFGIGDDGPLSMGAGMVGGEAVFPDLCIRLSAILKKNFGFTDEDLALFIVHIEGDTEHANEGKKLIRRYAKTPEQRRRFYSQCRRVRDRMWECCDAWWKAADMDLPQTIHPHDPQFAARGQKKAA